MRISVRVKTNSKKDSVEEAGENSFIVRVKAPAVEGRANEAVIDVLSDHFKRPKRMIAIVRGLSSKNKVIDIL
ncbi:MAG: DUF167 domain-containing protein [Candidatus Omnitrophota bacterium]